MAINLATGFSIGSKDLIYDKFVLTKQQMINIDENTYPDNFFALCSEDDSLYIFNVNNIPSVETGKFVRIGSVTVVDTVGKDNGNAISSKGVFSELYTEETVTIVDTEEGYVTCQSTDDGALEVVDDSVTPTSTQIKLSTVQVFVPTAQVGEYYQHQPEVSHEETIDKTIYIPRAEGYTKQEVDDKLAEINQLELMTVEEITNYMNDLVITANGYIPPTQG